MYSQPALEITTQLLHSVAGYADLKAMGGIPPLMAAFNHPHDVRVRTAAAYVIGTAASNNPTFQTHLLEEVPDIIHELMSVSPCCSSIERQLHWWERGTVYLCCQHGAYKEIPPLAVTAAILSCMFSWWATIMASCGQQA